MANLYSYIQNDMLNCKLFSYRDTVMELSYHYSINYSNKFKENI